MTVTRRAGREEVEMEMEVDQKCISETAGPEVPER